MAMAPPRRADGTDLPPMSESLQRGRDELRGLGDELGELFDDLRVLAQKEMELARTEVSESVAATKQSAMFGGAAAILALLTLSFAAVTLMMALDAAMPAWAAALITTLVLAALAGIAVMMLRARMKRVAVVPSKTMNSLNEDVRWARRQMTFNEK